MKVTLNVIFVFGIFNYTTSQFLTIGTSRKGSKSSCDPSSKSSLVEHFFNIIFTEFHNTPPVCVCVQMCPEQPTYCYPNGCLKRSEKSKKVDVPLPVTRISENTKPIFFIDEKNDFMNDFLSKNYIDESKSVAIPVPATPENNAGLNLRPDPFKDRYKILFKYKKMPKVELKYNLGEQVKNMKSDVLKGEHVDVSKTRWPMNKIDRRLVGQRMYNEPHVQKGTTNPRYFMTMFPDKDIASYPPKYFKRELALNTNSENKSDTDGVDIKAIYVVGKSETENSGFSLEKLIDSLIESSFDSNGTDLNKNVSEIEIETSISIPILNDSVVIKEHSTIVNNETTNVLSMNFTNENVDKNKYTEEFLIGNSSKTFSQMIATLAKRIDKQNNTSLEMMRRITGEFEFDGNVTTTDRPEKPTLTTSTDILTSETTSQPMDYETKTTKKSRQRFVRRLQHSKIN